MSSLPARLALVLLVLLGCSSYQVAPTPFRRPEQTGNTAVVFGATVAARAFDDPEEARNAFGGFDILSAGLLPIQVVFDNQGPSRLRINASQTFLEDQDENLWPILDQNLAYERAARFAQTNRTFSEAAHKGFLGAAAGLLVGAAIGVVTGNWSAAASGAAIGGAAGATVGGGAAAASGEARREVVQDLRQRDLENIPIRSGELAVGFIFFPGEVEDAVMLRLQLRDVGTGEVDTVELSLPESGLPEMGL